MTDTHTEGETSFSPQGGKDRCRWVCRWKMTNWGFLLSPGRKDSHPVNMRGYDKANYFKKIVKLFKCFCYVLVFFSASQTRENEETFNSDSWLETDGPTAEDPGQVRWWMCSGTTPQLWNFSRSCSRRKEKSLEQPTAVSAEEKSQTNARMA